MGFYANHIFPRAMDWALSSPRFQKLREVTLAGVHGLVLEIGFGTGLNLPHYPKAVSKVIGVEPGSFLQAKIAERSARAAMPVNIIHVTAETLPWEDAKFDCVVSTLTLCAIPDPMAALHEVRRVLKPDGSFIFLEHGRSDDPGVAKWQDRVNPIQRIIACGCNLNRRIDVLITESGLTMDRLDRFTLPGTPRIAGSMYRGRAVKES
ncbi:MAG: class I SAM-dependent methyltransferase [Nitrospiraceae bacterium]